MAVYYSVLGALLCVFLGFLLSQYSTHLTNKKNIRRRLVNQLASYKRGSISMTDLEIAYWDWKAVSGTNIDITLLKDSEPDDLDRNIDIILKGIFK